MPPEEVGDAECSALKTTWEPLITAEFAALVFDKKKLSLGQDGCVGVVADLIAQLQGPYARQHSDLLLRYVSNLSYILSDILFFLLHVLLSLLVFVSSFFCTTFLFVHT